MKIKKEINFYLSSLAKFIILLLAFLLFYLQLTILKPSFLLIHWWSIIFILETLLIVMKKCWVISLMHRSGKRHIILNKWIRIVHYWCPRIPNIVIWIPEKRVHHRMLRKIRRRIINNWLPISKVIFWVIWIFIVYLFMV